MTWPNSYPCVQDAAAVRSGDGEQAISRLAWTAPACNQGRLSPESRGIRVAAVLGHAAERQARRRRKPERIQRPESGPQQRRLVAPGLSATETKGQNMNQTLTMIKAGQLTPSPHNPRREMSAQGLAELADSIRQLGVLEPLLVRPKGKGFEILAGHRRCAAAKQAGITELPCLVHEIDDKTAIEITVTENLQREQLTPLEEAKGLASLEKAGWNHETMAAELGKSGTWVARRMSLLNLAPEILKAIDAGVLEIKARWGKSEYGNVDKWPARTLEMLAALPADTQMVLLQHMLTEETAQMLMPEDVKRGQGKIMHVLSAAPFDKADVTLNPKQGACTACDLRASCRKSLFDDAPEAEAGKIPRNDRCLNPVCFKIKLDEHNKRKIAEVKAKHGAVRIVSEDYNKRETMKLEYPAVVYNSYGEWENARQDEPGAVYEYDIDSGKGRWIKRRKAGRTGVTESSGPTPLKTRRLELQQRRMAWIIKKIHDHVEKQDAFPADGRWGTIPAQLLALACFGVAHAARQDPGDKVVIGRGVGKDITADPWQLVEDLVRRGAQTCSRGSDDGEQLAFMLYDHLGGVLLSRTRVWGGSFRSIDVGKVEPECRHVCDVFCLDYDAIKAQAEQELPEPPGWARLNPDGTPKAKPDKAKKAAPKGEKPAKGKSRPKAKAGGK